jgi:hypothetical protein
MTKELGELKIVLEEAQTAVDRWNIKQMFQTTLLKNEAGKPLYSNVDMRTACLYELQDIDPEYLALESKRSTISKEMITVQYNLSIVKTRWSEVQNLLAWALATAPVAAQEAERSNVGNIWEIRTETKP